MVANALTLSIAQIVPVTEAEGPGKRFALWFQGCPLRCPGCCNPEFLSFRGGTPTPLGVVLEQLDEAVLKFGIEGISLLGGEPFAHAGGGVAVASAARERGLSVMIYSGYTLDEIKVQPDPAVHALLKMTDVLVDGPYDREQPDTQRRWIGSTNQHVHFLSDRYRPDEPCWVQRNTLEIRVRDGQIVVNGFPAPAAVGLWKPNWQRKGSA